MSIIEEPAALENLLENFPNADLHNIQNGLDKLRTKILRYKTASKSSFLSPSNDFYIEAECITDKSVNIFSVGTQSSIQELIQDASCQLNGFALQADNENWDTSALDIDFCIHAAFECCNLGIPFASMTPVIANDWLENGDIIKISEISMQALVDPIIEMQPEKVLFVPCSEAELVDGQYFSSCGYYMLDSTNTVIKKVVVLIKHCPTTQNGTKNSVAQLVRDYKAIQRMYFMGGMKKGYFQFKYAGLTAASTLD
ncbi:MAG: hypothetical protein RSC10_10100 [Longicatena sp.]